MLPPSLSSSAAAPLPVAVRVPEFLRRAFQSDQMEIDSAISQIWSCFARPSLVRAISTVAFGISLQATPFRIVYNVLFKCSISHIACGLFLATGLWFFVSRFLMASGTSLPHEVRREVEWQFCLDIRCNAYAGYAFLTQYVHYVLLQLVLKRSWLATLLSNLMFAVAVSSYLYVTLRVLVELPSLHRQQIVLYPILAVGTLFLLGTVRWPINMSHIVLGYTWPEFD